MTDVTSDGLKWLCNPIATFSGYYNFNVLMQYFSKMCRKDVLHFLTSVKISRGCARCLSELYHFGIYCRQIEV